MFKDRKQSFKNKIDYLRQKYNFMGPLHFTDYTNLGKILNEGYLYSRVGCSSNGIDFRDVADQSVIEYSKENVKKCTRFYYKEKTPTLYRNEGIKKCANNEPHIPLPVYLLFSNDLILLNNTIFADGNAASNYTRYGNDFEFFDKMNWDYIMHRGPIYEETYDDYIMKLEIKRCRNAELMSLDPVPLKYLEKIIFRSYADKVRAINELGYNKKYEVNKNMFNNENNYLSDYLIYLNEDNIQLKLQFEKLMTYNEFKNYCELIIYDKNGKRVKCKYYYDENRNHLNLRINNLEADCEYNDWSYIYVYLHGIKVLDINVKQAIETKAMVDSGTLKILKDDSNELIYKYSINNTKATGYEKKFVIINKFQQVTNILRDSVDLNVIGKEYKYINKINDIEKFSENENRFEFSLNNIIIISEEIKERIMSTETKEARRLKKIGNIEKSIFTRNKFEEELIILLNKRLNSNKVNIYSGYVDGEDIINSKDEVSKLINEGFKKYQKRDYGVAISIYERALNLDKNNYLIYYHIANCFGYMVGGREKSLEYYNWCLSLKEDFLEAYLDKAAIEKNIPGYTLDGINTLKKALKYYPNIANIYSQLADLYMDMYKSDLRKGQDNNQALMNASKYYKLGLNSDQALKWDSLNKKWIKDKDNQYLNFLFNSFKKNIKLCSSKEKLKATL